jgi:MFS family permease
VAQQKLYRLIGTDGRPYGPPIYLNTVHESRGWSLALISAAVTTHFLFGALVVANLPKLYKRLDVSAVTKAGCIALAAGIFGWAVAREPWQLFLATLLSGGGWVTMSAAAVNAIVSPWFVRSRAIALASAYNGSSIGGVIFSPLWVAAIGLLGFPAAALAIGLIMIATIWVLADIYYVKTPEQIGLVPDGETGSSTAVSVTSALAAPSPGHRLWRNRQFLTLAGGMALGLFAQIGLLSQLFSLLVPALDAQLSGVAAGLATASAIAGRTLWMDDAERGRSSALRVRQLSHPDRRGIGVHLSRGHSCPHARIGRPVVRLRNRKRHLAAAVDRSGRVLEGRCCARRAVDRSN